MASRKNSKIKAKPKAKLKAKPKAEVKARAYPPAHILPIPSPVPEVSEDHRHPGVSSPDSKPEKTALQVRTEKNELEERFHSIEAVEKLHQQFLLKMEDASKTLLQAIACAVHIEARCTGDRSNRELHLGRRIQVKDMAMFAASLNGQIQRFTKRNSFRVPVGLESARESIRTQDIEEVFR